MVNGITRFFQLVFNFVSGLFDLTIPGTNFSFLGFTILCFCFIFAGHIIKLMIGGD